MPNMFETNPAESSSLTRILARFWHEYLDILTCALRSPQGVLSMRKHSIDKYTKYTNDRYNLGRLPFAMKIYRPLLAFEFPWLQNISRLKMKRINRGAAFLCYIPIDLSNCLTLIRCDYIRIYE